MLALLWLLAALSVPPHVTIQAHSHRDDRIATVVILSLAGLLSGLVVAGGLVAGKRLDGWTGLFLVTTAATSAQASGFPSQRCCRRTWWRSFRS
jgi:hypothetical protein